MIDDCTAAQVASSADARREAVATTWVWIKRQAPKVKGNIRQSQEREGKKVKTDLTDFATTMKNFHDEFKKQSFYLYETSPEAAFEAVIEQHSQLVALEKKLEEQAYLAALFECVHLVDEPRRLINQCTKSLRNAKQLWDCIMMCHSYFSAWDEILWDDIETEGMEDQIKRFKNEVRNMPKPLRQEFAAYEGLRETVNDMGTSLPVIGDLHHDYMRKRHWEAIIELTQVNLDASKISEVSCSVRAQCVEAVCCSSASEICSNSSCINMSMMSQRSLTVRRRKRRLSKI